MDTALRWALAGLLAACLVVAPTLAAPVRAGTGQPASPAEQVAAAAASYRQTQQDIRAVQDSLGQLDQEISAANGLLAAAERKAADDQQREHALRKRAGAYARSAYQSGVSWLPRVLEARGIAEAWDVLAEARLVAERQQALVDQIDQLRRTDEAAREQARQNRDALANRREHDLTRLGGLEAQLSALLQVVAAAGQVLAGSAGRVPALRLPQNTGADGQCTWYAEQAWVMYSDPSSPVLSGDGADVVPNLARATGRSVVLEPQPGSLVSWGRPLFGAHGHVAYVAAVDRGAGGWLTGYTVWEMNYVAPFRTDARHVTWSGPSRQVLFLSPPAPVDPVAVEHNLYGS